MSRESAREKGNYFHCLNLTGLLLVYESQEMGGLAQTIPTPSGISHSVIAVVVIRV
jgi:hypothetical protein